MGPRKRVRLPPRRWLSARRRASGEYRYPGWYPQRLRQTAWGGPAIFSPLSRGQNQLLRLCLAPNGVNANRRPEYGEAVATPDQDWGAERNVSFPLA